MQFRDHPGVQGKRDAYPFDPRLLKIEPNYNVRDLDTDEDLGELKESIRANGVRVPLEVRLAGEDVFVVAGHRRHRAVMELIAEGEEIKSVPVMPEPKGTNDAERVVNLVVSNSGKPLKPLEIAEVVRRLSAFGWEKGQIARRLGWKSSASVDQHLDLLALSEPIKQHVRNGEISATLAKNIAKGVDPKFAEDLIKANLEENRKIKGKRAKVTPKQIKRDAKPKAPEPEKEEPQAAPSSQPETLVSAPEPQPQETVLFTPVQEIALTHFAGAPPAREFPPEAFDPPSKASEINADLFGVVAKLATEAQDQLVGDRDDNDTFPCPVWLGKRALMLNAKLVGDE